MIPFGFGNKNKFIIMKDQSGPKSSKRWILIILLVGICTMSSTISSQGKINIGMGIDLLDSDIQVGLVTTLALCSTRSFTKRSNLD
jgi:hypothetical protein